MNKIYALGLLTAISMAGCKPDLKSDAPTANGLDFSKYVAIGNSLTAGFADGSLYRYGQINSYPAILAEQFRMLGGGEFRQPLLNGEAGFPGPKYVLSITTDCKGNSSLAPVPFGIPDTANESHSVVPGPYNNLGIPGIRAVDYLSTGYGFFNPYAARIFDNILTESPLDQVHKIPPTFFTIWLGNNDVLGYALSGGEGSPLAISPDNISQVEPFKYAYDSVVKTVVSAGAKGVLINIPDVTSIPVFTTVPVNGLQLTADQAAGLTAAYTGTGMSFSAGANNFVIKDPDAPTGVRQIKNGELILLSIPQDSLKCYGWGSTVPIPTRYVLTAAEISKIRTATTAFNSFIQAEAIKYKLAFADMNSYLKTLQSGIRYNGVDYNTEFVTGGAFSLDGVHLTPRGAALTANEIIRVINGYYGSTIPTVNANKYGGVRFP